MSDEGVVPGSMHRPMLAQTKEKYRALGANDMRVSATDVMSIKSLEDRYGKELDEADKQMKLKKESDSALLSRVSYDYEGDWRFQQWRDDKAKLKERLGIHWVDEFLDNPSTQLTYFLRVGTTLGMMHGIGRSVYLFRTIDRAYAKLHGASFHKIAGVEICMSVVKGAACAVTGVVGVTVGESSGRLFDVISSGEVAAPERRWVHVVSAASVSSAFAGLTFSALHSSVLSAKGVCLVSGCFAAIGTGGGYFLAKKIYEPFAASRRHRIDDPHWRPWNERQLTMDGGKQVRGRYR